MSLCVEACMMFGFVILILIDLCFTLFLNFNQPNQKYIYIYIGGKMLVNIGFQAALPVQPVLIH